MSSWSPYIPFLFEGIHSLARPPPMGTPIAPTHGHSNQQAGHSPASRFFSSVPGSGGISPGCGLRAPRSPDLFLHRAMGHSRGVRMSEHRLERRSNKRQREGGRIPARICNFRTPIDLSSCAVTLVDGTPLFGGLLLTGHCLSIKSIQITLENESGMVDRQPPLAAALPTHRGQEGRPA